MVAHLPRISRRSFLAGAVALFARVRLAARQSGTTLILLGTGGGPRPRTATVMLTVYSENDPDKGDTRVVDPTCYSRSRGTSRRYSHPPRRHGRETLLDLFWEDGRLNVHAGELEVCPPLP